MTRSEAYDGKTKRKRPKRCTLAIYHTGSVILFIGIIVAIVGVATSQLFHVYVYDHRKPARFLHVHVPVGLFSQEAKITWLSLIQEDLPYGLELDDRQWIGAKISTVIGLMAAILALVLHLIFSFLKIQRSWKTILIEVCFLLLAVIAILIGLSLAESEIEVIHDDGDTALTKLLISNQLLAENDLKFLTQISSNPTTDARQDDDNKLDSVDDNASVGAASGIPRGIAAGGDFALFLSSPQLSFALLIAAEFLLLLAFLAVLIYFVHVCEKAEEARKELRRAELS